MKLNRTSEKKKQTNKKNVTYCIQINIMEI